MAKLTENPLTGQPHTAKWPTIIAFIGAVLVVMIGLFGERWTGVGIKPAMAVAVFLLGLVGWGAASMAKRA